VLSQVGVKFLTNLLDGCVDPGNARISIEMPYWRGLRPVQSHADGHVLYFCSDLIVVGLSDPQMAAPYDKHDWMQDVLMKIPLAGAMPLLRSRGWRANNLARALLRTRVT
jgi:hypothetical protein